MSKAAAIEFETLSIRVNMIHSGGIETKKATRRWVPTYYDWVHLGWIDQPIEIVKAVSFLASDDSSLLYGQRDYCRWFHDTRDDRSVNK